jgi:hypothetical protein
VASASRTIVWIRRLVPMGIGAGLLYLLWLLVASNSEVVEVDFLLGRVELAVWQALAVAFVCGVGLVGLYTLYLMARGGLVQRRYRKQLAGLESEVHQLRNLPLRPDEAPESPASAPFEDDLDFASEGGGSDRPRG